MSAPRLLFAGTPEFAVVTLAALIDAGYPPIAVYTQPDRPAGRGRRLQQSPVKQLALAHAIPVYQPASLKRDPEAVAELQALGADLMIVIAYGLLLPDAVLAAPRIGCVNVHASLLPRWRGAAPIQRALLAGDAHSGVCLMRMEAGLDTGPVYRRAELPIATDETGGSLHDKLAALGAATLLATLPDILAERILPEPQTEALATYAHKLAKDDAWIDWSSPAEQIERQVRALDPWPVAQTQLQDQVLRIWQARAVPGDRTDAPPGMVLNTAKDGIQVAAGAGTLIIERLQPAGKKPMTAAEFLNARRLDGSRLG